MDTGAALTAILFILTLITWGIWTGFFLIFIAHYVLTTLSDTSSGQDEIHFPNEWFLDWWWKPILLGWVLLMFVVPTALVLIPVGIVNLAAYGIVGVLVLWLLYPLGLASALYTQNWLRVLHFGVIGRMLFHLPAFVYVYGMTLAVCTGAGWLVERTLMHSMWWGALAIVCVPAAILLYARHWGRFAWLALNHLPRYAQGAKAPKSKAKLSQPAWPEGDLPPMQAAKSAKKKRPVQLDEDAIDKDPYAVIDRPAEPSFEETGPSAGTAPTQPAQAPAPHLMVEEEDEWATDKKPYNVSVEGPALPSDAPPELPPPPDMDSPIAVSAYFDERARKEKEKARRDEEFRTQMPALKKKPPTFYAALLAGVWSFLFYQATMQITANLVVFTLIEIFLMYMLKVTWPAQIRGG